jgi:hypothetical protein
VLIHCEVGHTGKLADMADAMGDFIKIDWIDIDSLKPVTPSDSA